MRSLASWFCAVLTVLVLLPRPARADDPTLDYTTIETPHFWVHYHTGTEALAWKVARVAEQAHTELTPLLDWVPTGRTHIVVNDKIDTANGSATVFGRKHINVYGMPPESDSVLGFYDDWLRVLVYHEYVHILQLDTILGIPPLINAVIGTQWIPGQTLPRWYIEGLATYYESAHTRGGRVNSSLFKMYLRVAALEDTFLDIGAATGLPIQWPSGSSAYLYGGFFLDYVFRKHGEFLGSQFNRAYGRRILPWGLNSIARDLSGDTFDELWDEWTADQQGLAAATRIAVRASGETTLTPVTRTGGNSGFPNLRPGTGEIWFYEFDHETAPAYTSVLSTGTNREREFEVEAGAGDFGFTPDGEELVYTQSMTTRSTYRYLDLYVRNLKRGTSRRITHAERAREPAVSPDGKWLVYVRNRGGTMELVLRSFKHPSGAERVLLGGTDAPPSDPVHWQQIATPTWSPDSRQIAFSWWREVDGNRDIWLVDITSGETRRATNDFALDVDPNWSSDGTIYFSSDRTGIFNIYSLDPTTFEIRQRSNVVSGVFTPQLARDGRTMFVSTYGPRGFDIASFRINETSREAESSEVDDLPIQTYPAVDVDAFRETSYQAGRWLGPLRLVPELGVVTGGAGAGVAIVGSDPVGHHSYQLSTGYTTGRELTDKSVNASFGYGLTRLPVGVSLSGAFRENPRSRELFVQSEFLPYTRRQLTGRLALSYSFRELVDTLTLTASYEVDHAEFARIPEIEHDPADLEPSYPQHGFFNELGLRLNYTSRESFPRSVTTAKGWSGYVSLSVQDPALGSDYRNVTFGYGFDIFVQNPVWPRHSFALLLDGALTISELDNARRYGVGGNSPQDVFTSIVLQRQRRTFVVRGYEPGATSGSQYQVGQFAYRFPLLDLDKGFSTVPVFLRQLRGSVFLDHGGAYSGFLADADLLTGVGAEVLLESVFAYYLFGNLRLGYARGLGAEGIHEVYALFGGGF